ncbi:MAG: abortive infection family protein [Hyphomicrobiales bacterium]|nr:abortive infection family protein [Hyphomicrobiales bacterium]
MPEKDFEDSSELPDISRDARKNIFDGVRLKDINVFGRLNDVDFLGRLYDLEYLQSTDIRYSTAAADIRQHCVNNRDWDEHWFLNDARFNLMSAPPKKFIQFLCEMLHPAVRFDQDEVLKLLQHFNEHLEPHGWQLVEAEKITGRPCYKGQNIQNHHHHSVLRAQTAADALDANYMKKEIERARDAIDTDPALAIGTAKELIESCCKTILTRREVPFNKSDDLPKLTKALTKELKLTPDDIPDKARGVEIIKLILKNLSALTKYIAELRGLYGSGHGRDGEHKGLEPRHARLAVTSAIAFVDFVTETYRQRMK